MLLATVTGVTPLANSFAAPVSANVSATFDQQINPVSATDRTFSIHSMQQGQLVGTAVTIAAAGAAVTADPSAAFFPGELVQATATSGIQSATPAAPYVWQFRAQVTSGSGQFTNSQVFGPAGDALSAALGDLDRDGDLDIFFARDVVENRVWFNNGNAVFTDSSQSLGGGTSLDVDLGDIDGDGDLDAFVVNNNQPNAIWLNNGSGVFTPGQTLISNNSEAVELADFDGDGDLDAFVANRGAGNQIFFNSAGTFVDSGQTLGSHESTEVEVGDLDGDGDLDAIVGNYDQGNRVWLNGGAGTLIDSGQSIASNRTSGLAIGDVDGDGDLDAFEANGSGFGSRLFLNDGTSRFVDSGQILGGNGDSFSAALGDLDGDGDLDAVVGNNITSQVYLNDGTGAFTLTEQLTAGSTRRTPLGDLDGDGDLDIITASASLGTPGSRVWINARRAPVVTLSVDRPAIAEAGGVVTVTATLSSAHSQPVTVDLGFSGTATQTADYTTSGTQVLIPIGATNATVLITAVQDVLDEADETVLVDIVGVTNATGSGQVMTTITDDDDPLLPTVTLTTNETSISENGGEATVTATLSSPSTTDVTVNLGFGGTATRGSDYVSSSNQIVIPAAQTESPNLLDRFSFEQPQPLGTLQAPWFLNIADPPGPATTSNVGVNDAQSGPFPTDGRQYLQSAIGFNILDIGPDIVEMHIEQTVDISAYSSIRAIKFGGDGSGTSFSEDPTIPAPVFAWQYEIDLLGGSGGPLQASSAPRQGSGVTLIELDDETLFTSAALASATQVKFRLNFSAASAGIYQGFAFFDWDNFFLKLVYDNPVGGLSGSTTVTATADDLDEQDETVVVDIIGVTGAVEDGVQQTTTTIIDDDPTSFRVSTFNPTSTGFTAQLSADVDASVLSLYQGPEDVTLVGASGGPVRTASLVVDSSLRTIQYIQSGGPLAADTYTVTLRSGNDAFKDTAANLLDGNGDGSGGDDFVTTFTVSNAPTNAVTIGVPDFVRGPGQDVNLPADDVGLPVTISATTGLRTASFSIDYDPSLLSITAVAPGANMPAGSIVTLDVSTAGTAVLTFSSPTDLPVGPNTLVNLTASIPSANASANYRRQQVLDIHSVVLSDRTGNQFPVVEDDALHVVTFLGDVSGNGRINSSDAAQVARVAALLNTGFSSMPRTDPGIVGDISGNGRINATDASLLAQHAALIAVPQIPPIPSGVAITGLGVGVGQRLTVRPSEEDASTPALTGRFNDLPAHDNVSRPSTPAPREAVDEVMAGHGNALHVAGDLVPDLEAAIEELLSICVSRQIQL